MDEELEELLKKEKEIPVDVMERLVYNQNKILNQEIKQNKKVAKISMRKRRIITFAIAGAVILIGLTKIPIGEAIERVFGISQDSGVTTVENNSIPTELNLISSQNGREIKITKFIATKQKFAFDYQFEIDDEQLKSLLEKQVAADSNSQFIELGLFANGSTEDLFGGGAQKSTFRVEGNKFYGSVVFTYDNEKIPEDADLALHIYKLSWQDRDEYDVALAEATKTGNSFSVPWALQYEGDWSFDIAYQPLTQTAEPDIIQKNNIYDINAKSDALQTTIEFVAPTEVVTEGLKLYNIEVYKNGVQIEAPSYHYEDNSGTTKFTISIDFSALDKTSVYKIELSNADDMGERTDKIGTFEIQNK